MLSNHTMRITLSVPTVGRWDVNKAPPHSMCMYTSFSPQGHGTICLEQRCRDTQTIFSVWFLTKKNTVLLFFNQNPLKPNDLINNKPALVQIVAWPEYVTSLYQNKCWLGLIQLSCITRPQRVDCACAMEHFLHWNVPQPANWLMFCVSFKRTCFKYVTLKILLMSGRRCRGSAALAPVILWASCTSIHVSRRNMSQMVWCYLYIWHIEADTDDTRQNSIFIMKIRVSIHPNYMDICP